MTILKRLAGTALVLLISTGLFAQEACKVLMQTISGTYVGSCKKGLADGSGEAKGIDKYAGEFRKGYPDGMGTYIWSTGETYNGQWKHGLRNGQGKYMFKHEGRDSSLTGMWRDDKFMGEKEVQPYVIEYRNGIGRVSCMRVGDRPYIKYKFQRGGGESNEVSNVLLQGNSGTESNTTSFTGFEQVKFPFKGKVTFIAPNEFHSAMLNCELRILINQPGSWVVTISF
jgi:hypothetical protein